MPSKTKPKPAGKPAAKKPAAKKPAPTVGDQVAGAVDVLNAARVDAIQATDFETADNIKRALRELAR